MTILLEILAVGAVIFVAAAYAVGWWGEDTLAIAPPDAGTDGLPDGRLSPAAVDRTRFGLAFRGYRMAEVDDVLDRLRDELASRDSEIDALKGVADTGPTLVERPAGGSDSVDLTGYAAPAPDTVASAPLLDPPPEPAVETPADVAADPTPPDPSTPSPTADDQPFSYTPVVPWLQKPARPAGEQAPPADPDEHPHDEP